jgi:peptidoglycan/LPS O-acetylase OafA/YrhL
MSTERTAFLAPLTGIRFVAAVFVFNAHVILPVGAPVVFGAVQLAGHDWMTMFFVLSGLILTWNYDKILGDRLNAPGLRTYYVARLARIYPLYLAALLIAVLSLSSDGELFGILRSGEFWVHVFAVQTWSPDLLVAYGLNGPGWSIGIEFFLYALFPLLLILFRRIRDRPGALIAVGLGAIAVLALVTLAFSLAGLADLPRLDPTSAHRWLYRTPLTRVPDFVLGIALGYLALRPPPANAVRWGRAAQAVGAVGILVSMAIPALAFSVWSLDVANMLPFALIMIGLVWAPESLLARALGSRPMVFLGECSFAFYLLHQTIVRIVGQPDSGWTEYATHWMLAFVITLLASAGGHLMIERPLRSGIRAVLDRPRAPQPVDS